MLMGFLDESRVSSIIWRQMVWLRFFFFKVCCQFLLEGVEEFSVFLFICNLLAFASFSHLFLLFFAQMSRPLSRSLMP